MNGKLRNMTSLYLKNGDSLLLLYRIGSRVIAPSYTGSAGGHFEKDELNDAEACALRELYEETGLTEQDIENLSLRYITLRLKNSEIRQNYYFFADLPDKNKIAVSNEGKLKWFSINDLLEEPPNMPFSAQYVIAHYVRYGKDNEKLYAGIAAQDGVEFTEMEEF